MVYISASAFLSSLNLSTWFQLLIDGTLNDGSVSNTSDDGTSLLGAMVQFIASYCETKFQNVIQIAVCVVNVIEYSSDWVIM